MWQYNYHRCTHSLFSKPFYHLLITPLTILALFVVHLYHFSHHISPLSKKNYFFNLLLLGGRQVDGSFYALSSHQMSERVLFILRGLGITSSHERVRNSFTFIESNLSILLTLITMENRTYTLANENVPKMHLGNALEDKI